MDERVIKTAEALRGNRMEAYLAESAADVAGIVRSLLKEGDKVAFGGSETLKQTGVLELLSCGDYDLLDRRGKNPDEVRRIYAESFTADAYFCSSNAITETGLLYNVDGNANRIAAIAYGPKSVIIVAGKNKIVKDLAAAERRVKLVSAPKNTVRLGLETFCSAAGQCASAGKENAAMCDGCRSDARICCSYLVCGPQRVKGRIKVILVNEDLGY